MMDMTFRLISGSRDSALRSRLSASGLNGVDRRAAAMSAAVSSAGAIAIFVFSGVCEGREKRAGTRAEKATAGRATDV